MPAALNVADIVAVARFRDLITPHLQRLDKNLVKAGSAMTTAGNRLKALGKSAMGVSVAMAAAIGAAAVAFGRFEYRMNRVAAVTGATGVQMGRLTDLARELGRTTRFSASEAAEGMGYLGMAGFKANEILSAMPGVLDLAAAGQLNLAVASDIASNVLSGFGMRADEIGRVADVMAKTFTSSNTSMKQLGDAFKFVGPVAKSANQEFEMMSAMLGQLGNAGIQASEGGTALRNVILRLARPTGKAAAVLERVGVAAHDMEGRIRPLNQIMHELGAANLTVADTALIFGVRAAAASGVLMRFADDTDRLAETLRNAGGAAKEVADRQLVGLYGAFIKLKSATEGMLIAVGDVFSGALENLLDVLTRLVRWMTSSVIPTFQAMPGLVRGIIFVVAGLVAAFGAACVRAGSHNGRHWPGDACGRIHVGCVWCRQGRRGQDVDGDHRAHWIGDCRHCGACGRDNGIGCMDDARQAQGGGTGGGHARRPGRN